MKLLKLLIPALLSLGTITAGAQRTQIKYLSGSGTDDTVDWEFYCTGGRNSGEWTTIPVPSCWELQGFGTYNYGHDPFNERGMEKGLYRHRFDIPAEWKGNNVSIVFEGSMTDTEVRVNGKQAGEIHQGSFYRFAYDISKMLRYGDENLLEVTVAKHSANDSVNHAERKADYWIFGGIFRPVWLEMKPPVHIDRIALDARADGNFSMEVFVKGSGKNTTVTAVIEDAGGKSAGPAFSSETLEGSGSVLLKTRLKGIQTWSPETPELYRVRVSIEKGGRKIHMLEENFGFRTVEHRIRDGIYLNGVKVKFRGVCRHSFHPETGRSMSLRRSIEDVSLIKDMNMNAVRMSHYPPDPHFLDVCDSMGLLVLNELAGWHNWYDTETGSRLVHEMVSRDVNHPCIVIWDNGNENGWNTLLDTLFDQLDPQGRPLIHPWQVFREIDTQHYPDWDYGNYTHQHGPYVTFPTEFLHGLYDGGHGAGLEDFWRQMWDNPLSAGGFLWAFADEAVVRTDKGGVLDTDGNHAPDGILGPYHEREGSYYSIRKIWSPVFFEKRFITEKFNGRFTIENRYHFTSLKDCSFSYELMSFSGPGRLAITGAEPHVSHVNELNPFAYDEVLGKHFDETSVMAYHTGEIPSPDIEPGQKGTLELELPLDFHTYEVLYIHVDDPHGRRIGTWSWPVKLPSQTATLLTGTAEPARTEFRDRELILSAKGILVSIDRATGLLREVCNEKGSYPIKKGPVFMGLETTDLSVTAENTEGRSRVRVESEDGRIRYTWTMYPEGILGLEAEYLPDNHQDLMGIGFDLEEGWVREMTWKGDGPYRVYKNRLKGPELGIWRKENNNTITGVGKPVYPEFKGYHSRLYWVNVRGAEKKFRVATTSENIFLHMLTPEFPPEDLVRHTKVVYPEGGISFLHGIPAIGTKFRPAENTGPMGEKNLFNHKKRKFSKSLELFFDFREN